MDALCARCPPTGFLDTLRSAPLFLSFARVRSYASERASAAFANAVRARWVPMFIEIHELQHHPVDFKEEISPGVIDLGPDVRQTAMLYAAGRAQLIEEQHGKHEKIDDIRLNGELA